MRLVAPALLAVASALQVSAGHSPDADTGLAFYMRVKICEVDLSKYLLLQQCPPVDWTSIVPTGPNGTTGTNTGGSAGEAPPTGGAAPRDGAGDEDLEDLATSSFMSFEQWKETMLQKTGQDPADLKERKRSRDRVDLGPNDILDSWGDDGEIALDFDVLSGKTTDMADAAGAKSTPGEAHKSDEKAGAVPDDGMATYRRPKDAGKTCKERFSYASFDGGATILKTSPGAQNPKAILIENKDAYMLFTCSQENKFVIVELSEDILVDTVVLANFEFFSSTIRSFRVSVSDKYPVKMDKWKDIGTYHARNSRNIQSFLIENPKIYAKYIRIEFLSHYGKEYYCPVSLLRVHGTRMLDSWKDVENAVSEEDEPVEVIQSPEPVPEPDTSQEDAASQSEAAAAAAAAAAQQTNQTPSNDSLEVYGISPWYPPLDNTLNLETCALSTPTTTGTAGADSQARKANSGASPVESSSGKGDEVVMTVVEATASSTSVAAPSTSTSSSSTDASVRTMTPETMEDPASSIHYSGNRTQAAEQVTKSSVTPASGTKSDNPSSKPPPKQSPNNIAKKNSTGTSSSAPASPTIQESFFKSMSKRITYAEGNITLLAQYIEEQSKFLQDALQRMERRQIKRVDDFLHHLNQTVLGDIVLTLESHRLILDRHDRQVVALSSQLNRLAGDVGLLKIMIIILIVLIVFLILLVLVSLGVQNGTAAEQWAATSGQIINTYLGSPRLPPGSPQSARGSAGNTTPTQHGLLRRQRAGPSLMRHNSSGSGVGVGGGAGGAALRPGGGAGSRSVSSPAAALMTDKDLPLTPTSDVFDPSDNENGSPTPPSSRKAPRPSPPQILIDEAHSPIFADQHDDDGSDQEVISLGSKKTSRPLIEELPTPAEEVSTFMSGRAGGEQSEEVKDDDDGGGGGSDEVEDEVEDEDASGEPSQPPLTRSQLSELGTSSRKPLPALPEDPA
ncbi:unnamed protein product [Discula destructiva]